MRLDKWLWAARFFKTRALATHACELGRIACNTQQAKASRELRVSDMLQIKNDGGDFEVQVLGLSDVRGPAAVAQALYKETDASRELRAAAAAERKLNPQFETAFDSGRPSKRDRRDLDRLRRR